MSKTTALRLALIFLLAAMACGAGAQFPNNVQLQWNNGDPAVQLTLQSNPDYMPGSMEYPYEYYGAFESLTLAYPNALIGTVWGAPFKDPAGKPIRVRIKQTIQNVGERWWFDFHIGVGGDGRIYKKWDGLPDGWSTSQTQYAADYTADAPIYAIGPGGYFQDGLVFHVIATGTEEHTFTITKWPTVPEPATLGALVAGLAAMVAGVRYKKSHK